ncbi:hypothetical protein LINPERPRIM_LOCUS40149 [Linum perenne]
MRPGIPRRDPRGSRRGGGSDDQRGSEIRRGRDG